MIQPAAGSESLSHVLDKLAHVLNERRVSYALIGGLGVSMRGSMRTTQDVDLLIHIPQLQLPGVFEALAAVGFQIDVLEAIRVWNRDGLLDFNSGTIRVDWLKPVLPAFGRILERAKAEQVGDQMIRVADAEGLILMKLIAFRNRDQDDIKSILAANPGSLDLDWVRREWSQIAQANDPKTEQFEQLVRECYVAASGGQVDGS